MLHSNHSLQELINKEEGLIELKERLVPLIYLKDLDDESLYDNYRSVIEDACKVKISGGFTESSMQFINLIKIREIDNAIQKESRVE